MIRYNKRRRISTSRSRRNKLKRTTWIFKRNRISKRWKCRRKISRTPRNSSRPSKYISTSKWWRKRRREIKSRAYRRNLMFLKGWAKFDWHNNIYPTNTWSRSRRSSINMIRISWEILLFTLRISWNCATMNRRSIMSSIRT